MLLIDVVRESGNDTAVIRCSGEIDVATCAALIETFDTVLPGRPQHLRVDLQDVRFIDSTGIGCLLHAALQAQAAGTTFELLPGEPTLRFIRSSGLGNRLPIVSA
jgi:anti-sigma B factor antagonist